ncbi:MAG: DUF4143 domain-containing protein [Clostridia bacterium]
MLPLSFKEFMLACNKEQLLDEINNCYIQQVAMPEFAHNIAIQKYLEYLCIGGMPKAVLNFIENDQNIMLFNRDIIDNIITTYMMDMKKYTYTNGEIIKIQSVYETMPSQLAKDNHKFKYSDVKRGGTKAKFELPLEWLVSSNMLLKCNRIDKIEIPPRAFINPDWFKMYLSDVGILTNLCKISYSDILLDKQFMFKGAIAENYVACILNSFSKDLMYWRNNNESEIDFLIYNDDGIIPIEVKAGIRTQSKSLKTYMDKYNPKYGIRLSLKNFGFENNIKSIPLYAAHVCF